MIESREHFIKERLDYIRNSVKCGVKEFDYSKIFKIDLLIKDELDKMYDTKINNSKINDKNYVKNCSVSQDELKELKKLVLYYYAIYNDNLDLLKKLVEEMSKNSIVSYEELPQYDLFLSQVIDFLNDKFAFEVKEADTRLKNSENWEEEIKKFLLLKILV